MESVEKYNLVGGKTCKEVLSKYPNYKVFWRSGFAYRGATEIEYDKQPREEYIWQEQSQTLTRRVLSFEERMQRNYDWSAAIDIEVDHEKKEIHFNGFSENDMW